MMPVDPPAALKNLLQRHYADKPGHAPLCPACHQKIPARRVHLVPALVGDEHYATVEVSGRIWDSYAEIEAGWPHPLPQMRARIVDGVEFFDPVFA